jgi:NTE family protein
MTERKRTIGLALGSGAARGWAHIGVIRELEAQGIRPTIVTGSSVGAVIAAALASGRLDEFESWISGLGRFDIIRLLDARMSGGGLLKGDILMKAIEKKIGNPPIGDLDISFGCVATELGSGREIWLREGPLLEATRASISMPGLFAPTRVERDYLLDGGLVNPVPVSLARAMGADIVIAVNLNGDLVGQHFWVHPEQASEQRASETGQAPAASSDQTAPVDPSSVSAWFARLKNGLGGHLDSYISSLKSDDNPDPGLFDVIVGAIDIMQDRITRSRMAGEPPDVHITPRVSHIGLMDFDRADESIAEGRKAAQRRAEDLERVAGMFNG